MTTAEMIHQGKEQMRKLDFSNAQSTFQKALQKEPRSAEALALNAIIHLLAKDYPKAIALFEDSKAIDPKLLMIYPNLARAYRKTNLLDSAETIAREGIKRNP